MQVAQHAMEITHISRDSVLEVHCAGRLDSSWAGQLSENLAAAMRGGSHQIELNLKEITFISSAGLRVLMKVYKDLKAINGTFTITALSEGAEQVLKLSGFYEILVSAPAPVAAGLAAAEKPAVHTFAHGAGSYQIHELDFSAALLYRAFGNPAKLAREGYSQDDCQRIAFSGTRMGLGLGALGNDFDECAGRFGEFLSVANTAAYLPTDGSDKPDYSLGTGSLVPEIHALYGLICEGNFSHLLRFEAREDPGVISLSELAGSVLDLLQTSRAAFVIVAESAGLIGTALKRSPTRKAGEKPSFEFPEIRETLSFTTEPAFPKSLCLAVGVASRHQPGIEEILLRPLTEGSHLRGHFHAAAFRYRPLQKGLIDLHSTVHSLFEGESLESILHLIHDNREASSVGESEFFRGACWAGRLKDSD